MHVDAPPARVYAVLVDLKRFDDWQPWRKNDLVTKTHVTGEPGELGATYTWSGNDDVGSGSLTLTSLVEGERVEAEVRARAPWTGACHLAWSLRDEGDGTTVTWTVDGRAASLLDRDAMIGKELREGLFRLKHVAERD